MDKCPLFRDYRTAVVKRKKTVFLILGIVVLSSVVVLLVSPKIYQGSLVLQMGNLEGDFTRTDAAEWLASDVFLKDAAASWKGKVSLEDLKAMTGAGINFAQPRLGSQDLLVLTLRGRNPVLISEALDALGSTFVSASRDRLKSQLDIWQERLSWQNRQIKIMEEVLWEAKRTFSSPSMTQRRRQISSLERSYSDMVENRLAILKKIADARPAQIYSAGTVGKSPVLPRYMDQLLFSAIVGLVFGLCAVWIQEFGSQL